MKTKCEKCFTNITTKNIHKCNINEFSLCCVCYETMLCPICVMVWDICPSCLDKDNAVLYCGEQIPVEI